MKVSSKITWVLSFFLTACGLANDSALKRTEVPSTYKSYASLGQAYHADKVLLLNTNCVEGKVEEARNTNSFVSNNFDQTITDLLNRVNGSGSVQVGIPLVRVGGGAHYLKETASSSHSSTYHFNWSMVAKTRFFSPGSYKITATGYDAASHKENLVNQCGHEFVNAIQYGASLDATMKLEFLSEHDKKEIGGNLGVNIAGIIKVGGGAGSLDERVKKSIRVTVHATQKGGLPLELLQVFPGGLMTCDLSDLAPCQQALENIMLYAKEKIPQQLSSDQNLYVIKYTTESYGDSNISQLTPPKGYPTRSEEAKQQLLTLEAAYQKALLDQMQAARLSRFFGEYLSETDYANIVSIESKAKKNAALYQEASRYCYDNPYVGCEGKAAEALRSGESYDDKILLAKSAS